MPLPPRWLRRLVIAPGVVLLALLVVTTVPLWVLVAAAASPFVPGFLRPLRLLWLAVVYLLWDATALIALFGLWVASGFGWKKRAPAFQRAHYVLAGRFLTFFFWQARWTLRLRIDVAGADPDTALPGRPELVLCRHAGPGDSFILIHALVNWFNREPRIVLKDSLQWDPAIDVLLNRLPNRFIAPAAPAAGEGAAPAAPAAPAGAAGEDTGGRLAEQVGQIATGLDGDDVLVLFPEGGNFTPGRRARAIERLYALGLDRMARRAEAMRHVVAPRPGGVLAALDAAPEAGVVFVAHTGLDRMLTVADVWRELPMDKRIVMRFWSVPPDQVPAGRQERIDWLYDWWARIDRWIDAHR